MELPEVQLRLRDPRTNVVYEICGYRAVTREEGLVAIAMFNGQRKRKPKAGSVIRIVTTLGAQD